MDIIGNQYSFQTHIVINIGNIEKFMTIENIKKITPIHSRF